MTASKRERDQTISCHSLYLISQFPSSITTFTPFHSLILHHFLCLLSLFRLSSPLHPSLYTYIHNSHAPRNESLLHSWAIIPVAGPDIPSYTGDSFWQGTISLDTYFAQPDTGRALFWGKLPLKGAESCVFLSRLESDRAFFWNSLPDRKHRLALFSLILSQGRAFFWGNAPERDQFLHISCLTWFGSSMYLWQVT